MYPTIESIIQEVVKEAGVEEGWKIKESNFCSSNPAHWTFSIVTKDGEEVDFWREELFSFEDLKDKTPWYCDYDYFPK